MANTNFQGSSLLSRRLDILILIEDCTVGGINSLHAVYLCILFLLVIVQIKVRFILLRCVCAVAAIGGNKQGTLGVSILLRFVSIGYLWNAMRWQRSNINTAIYQILTKKIKDCKELMLPTVQLPKKVLNLFRFFILKY